MPDHFTEFIAVILIFSGTAYLNRYHKQAEKYVREKKYPEAIKAYSRLLILNQRSHHTLIMRGWANYEAGNLDKAIEDFSKIIKYEPRNSEVYGMRGFVYAVMKNDEAALRDFNRFIEFNPEEARSYLSRARLRFNSHEYDEAINDYHNALLLLEAELKKNSQPKHFYHNIDTQDFSNRIANSYVDRGLAYAKTKNYLSAILDYSRALELDPKNTQAFSNRALAYLHTSKFEEAIEDFSTSILLDLKDVFNFVWRGETFLKLKNCEAAIKDLTEAVKLNADDPEY
ncbi:MAG: tetratricopeptide repeat protein [Chloroflexota bacterium]